VRSLKPQQSISSSHCLFSYFKRSYFSGSLFGNPFFCFPKLHVPTVEDDIAVYLPDSRQKVAKEMSLLSLGDKAKAQQEMSLEDYTK
jgi:hypothetical protein